VTSQHDEAAPDDYLAMGERARKLGIVPDMLRPTCDDLAAIGDAGDSMVDVSLRTIARLTREQGRRLVLRNEASEADRGKAVLVYGGALHNDLPPPAGPSGLHPEWSYAPALDALVDDRMVALDFIVPEFIGDDPVWTALPWWSSYDRARMGSRWILFRTGDRSFVLVAPRTASDAG
jgi:hypothetical protein